MAWLVPLVGCGNDSQSDPVPLPSTLVVHAPATGEPGAALALSSSIGGTGSGIAFEWTFGDGNTSTAAEPHHAYAATGRYRVSLRVTNAAGDARSAEAEVLVRHFSHVQRASCVRSDRTGWCRQWPEDGSAAVVPLHHDDANTRAWGSGSDGRLYLTDATSSTWQAQAVDSPARRILHIGFDAAQQVGWALGVAADPPGVASRGVLLLKTTDGGSTWARQPLPAGWDIAKVEAGWLKVLDSQHVVLGHTGQGLVSADGGSTWTFTQAEYTAFGNSGTTVWSAVPATPTAPPQLRRSTDLGVSFEVVLTLAPEDTFNEVHFLDDLRGWAAIVRPAPESAARFVDLLFSTVDGGASWQALGGAGLERQATGLTLGGCTAPSFQFVDNLKGIATRSCLSRFARADGAWRTVDGGRAWSPIGTDGFCVGNMRAGEGRVWTDGGCPSLFPAPPSRKVYLSRDLGLTWTALDVGDEAPDSPVLGVSTTPDGAILLRHAAKTYRSTDQGASWQASKTWPAAAPAPTAQHALRFTSAGQGFAVGRGGQLMVTRDGGRQWQPQGLVVDTARQPTGRIEFATPETGWILGNSRFYRSVDGGQRWEEVLPSGGFLAHLHDFSLLGPTHLWATAAGLGLYTSTDGAIGWRQPGGAGSLGFEALGIRFGDAQRGVVVGNGGGIAFTGNAGEAWQRVDSGTGSTLRRVAFSNPTTAWAVGGEGTVRVSRDAGASWQQVAIDQVFGWNSVYFMDAQRGWIVGDYGSIASTRDGGQTWTLQESGTGEHLYDVFATDPETAWIVAERGSLYAAAHGGD